MKRTTLIVALLCVLAAVNANVSKQDAIDSVLTNIIGSDTINYNIYLEPNIFIEDWYLVRHCDSIQNTYSYSWVFFIDEMPNYNWGHDCSYIFMDSISGNYARYSHYYFPIGYKSSLEEISISYYDTASLELNFIGTPVINNYPPDPTKYAILFTGDSLDLRWNDLSHMYSAIKSYGFTDDNIYVFVPANNNWDDDLDQDGITGDFDGACTYNNIESTLSTFAEIMTEEDILFFYATTHGEAGIYENDCYLILDKLEDDLWDDEIAAMVQPIECSEMIFVIDACYSGGMIDDLEGDHRTVQTCTDAATMMTIDPALGYNFLTYAYGTALKGHHPIVGQPWSIGPNEIGQQDLGEVYLCWEDKDDIDPDAIEGGNGDGYYQLGEAFYYAKYLCGQIYNQGQNSQMHGFIEDLLSFFGIVGKVENSQTISGNFLIGKELTILDNITLTIDNNSKIFLNTDASLQVDSEGTLVFGDDVETWGFDQGNIINIEGECIFGSNLIFTSPVEVFWDGVVMDNTTNDYTIGSVIFENCTIKGNCNSLTISSSQFSNSRIDFSYGDLTINNNSVFNSSGVLASHPYNGNNFISIYDCDFYNSNYNYSASIDINDYKTFTINNCTIQDNDVAACISLYNAGGLKPTSKIIEDCIIHSSSSRDDNTLDGVRIYCSYVTLKNNYIYDNEFGIKCFNNSNVKLQGEEPEFTYEEPTQKIKNNSTAQVYASRNCFPTEFKWNSVYDDSFNTCFVYYTLSNCIDEEFIIDCNYWGGLDDEELPAHLWPSRCYWWEYIWPFCGTLKTIDPAEVLYDSTTTLIDSGFYSQAETILKQIILEYPYSRFATASVKDLFYLKEIHDQDYTGLQNYYDTAVNLQNQDDLDKLSDFFANRCDIELGNYQDAIDWFDNIIQSPDTLEDSVFAVIDRDYTILLMQGDTTRSNPGWGNNYNIPDSFEEFIVKRNELLNLLTVDLHNSLGIDDPSDMQSSDASSSLYQNFPNPFNSNTTFKFITNQGANVSIDIFNQLGVKTTNVVNSWFNSGEHSVNFHNESLTPGMYYYRLIIDDKPIKCKKLIIR